MLPLPGRHLGVGAQTIGERVGPAAGDGRLWIRGRLKRIAKVFGTRVSLDDVEAKLASFGRVAAIDAGERVCLTDLEVAIEGMKVRVEAER